MSKYNENPNRDALDNYQVVIEVDGVRAATIELENIFLNFTAEDFDALSGENSADTLVSKLGAIIQPLIRVSVAANICSITDQENIEFVKAFNEHLSFMKDVAEETHSEPSAKFR